MKIMNYPLAVFVLSVVVLWLSALVGTWLRKRRRSMDEEERQDFNVVLAATLTLLGLIIGFSFSMAISRYDQRKNYEEEEANAIGTEYVRAELLPAAEAEKVRGLLKAYLDQRIRFYEVRDYRKLPPINAKVAQLQDEMWSVVRGAGAAQPTPLMAVVVSGMNDVLNRQGYTQAAWWNRIPIAAWGLMEIIAICSNVLIGFSAHRAEGKATRFLVLPAIVAVSFLLIADIDSPRGGIIRIHPQNLVSLAGSLGVR
jgi:hypothetical protein